MFPIRFLLTIPLIPLSAILAQAAEPTKSSSAFYPPLLMKALEQNLERHGWAREAKERMIAKAKPWMGFSDEELWSLMYGPSIDRSWMVWSDGYCPSCKEPVPMYNWEMNPLEKPWKTTCPHCQESFPKNDFKKFYDSGLGKDGVFDPDLADRALLYNEEHPDPNDPKHLFGVDDGEGYVVTDGDKELRWRFIGAYLIYGQWKKAVSNGVSNLADAYTLTGDKKYAHKAAILLDRVADHYPNFEFKTQGILYEGPGSAGYITTWHDACEETRELALAYDQIFPGLEDNLELVNFLSSKAKECGLANSKSSLSEIRLNIEDRILRDALENQHKIHSNYPRREICVAVIMTVLGWPDNRAEVMEHLDAMIDKATAVDGVTGEKGLANYSAFVIQSLAEFLGLYTRMDGSFLGDLMDRHPNLKKTYRFHIDTWCGQKYYPLSGDTGWVAKPHPTYVGVIFRENPSLVPSMYSFLWSLYEETQDPAYVQVLYSANGGTTEGLPHDLFVDDSDKRRSTVAEIIEEVGEVIPLKSVNKEEWHLAILRSGSGENERSLWIDYDSDGGHSHKDGMNIGLFAKGLDLLPDFGYPAVQFGGWGSPRSRWYKSTLAHNTVVVDGQEQKDASGKTEFFADGETFRAMKVSGPEIYGVSRYERTLFLVDTDDSNSYALDFFHVVGGKEHTRIYHSSFGALFYQGLDLTDSEPWGEKTQMTDSKTDPDPDDGWQVDWQVEDRYGILRESRQVNLRLTDLTPNTQVTLAESWVNPGGFTTSEEGGVRTVLTTRTSPGDDLESTFLAILEPYEGDPLIARSHVMSPHLQPDVKIVQVALGNGQTDIFLLSTQGAVKELVFRDIVLNAKFAWMRLNRAGVVEKVAFIQGTGGRVGRHLITLDESTEFFESDLNN